MSSSRGLAAVVLLALLTAGGGCGCGGSEDQPIGLQIEATEAYLLELADFVAIYFYPAEAVCADLRSTQPRPRAVLGPFRADLDDQSRAEGITVRPAAQVPIGTYVLFVDALQEGGTVVGSGCAPDQKVVNRAVSRMRVVIQDNP